MKNKLDCLHGAYILVGEVNKEKTQMYSTLGIDKCYKKIMWDEGGADD